MVSRSYSYTTLTTTLNTAEKIYVRKFYTHTKHKLSHVLQGYVLNTQ